LIPILSKNIFYLIWTLQSYEIYKYKNLFVTYKGGNNHKHDRFYADRHVNKPAPAAHHGTPMAHGNKPAAHHPAPAPHHDKPAVHNNKPAEHNKAMRNAPSRQMAQATNTNRSGSGHFGGRR
jgi:hypothetical protein